MTIRELLNKISEEKPHSFSDAKLISFVNEVEAEVAEEMHIKEVPVYVDDLNDLDKRLLVPAPYDRLYVSYVKAMIDYANEEYGSYQLNQEQHVQDFRDFVDWVVREKRTGDMFKTTRFRHVF